MSDAHKVSADCVDTISTPAPESEKSSDSENPSEAQQEPERIYKTKPIDVLLASCSALYLMPFMVSSVNMGLPTIGADLGASAVQLGLVGTSYIVTVNIFMLMMGRIGDIIGRRRVFRIGVACFTLSTIALSLAPSVNVFLALRVSQGLGAAMINTSGMAMLVSVFPPEKRGQALGILTATVYAGVSSGPVIGGILTSHFGWRSIFILAVPMGLLAWGIAMTRLRDEWCDAKGEPFDFRGGLVYAASIVCITLGTAFLEQSYHATWMILAGLCGLVAFYFVEKHTVYPIVDVSIFTKSREFTFGCIAAWINFGAVTTIMMLMSFYIQVVQGLSPSKAGIMLVIQPITQMLLSPLGGRLADRFPADRMSIVGMVICAFGLFLAVGLDGNSGIYYPMAVQIIVGTGLAIFSPANALALMTSVEPRYIGIASGLSGTMRTLGIATCMLSLTVVFSIFMHGQPVTPATAPAFLESMHFDFILFAVLSLAGVALSFFRLKR